MARKTAAQIKEKYQRNMQGAGADYEAGVKNPSRPWEEATAQGAARWAQGVQEAVRNGTFEAGVRGKGDKWARKAASVGVQRYASAAATAAEEYGKVADRIISITSAVQQQIQSMPNATEQQREERALANMRGIRNAWKQS